MALLNQIRMRCSVRSYLPKPVEKDKLAAILEAARLAPSAKNLQEWRFVAVQNESLRKRLGAAACNQTFVGEAPVVIACCAVSTDFVMKGGQAAYPIDLAIAIEHMALQAVEEGLGSCWIGSFDQEQVKSILGIPDSARVTALMTLGYPAGDFRSNSRKPLPEIVCFERWGFKP